MKTYSYLMEKGTAQNIVLFDFQREHIKRQFQFESDIPMRHTRMRYYRFGVSSELFEMELRTHKSERNFNPTQTWISGFTSYWRLGVREVIDTVKRVFPDTTIVLGGRLSTEMFGNYLEIDHVIDGDSFDENLTHPGEVVVVKGSISWLNKANINPKINKIIRPSPLELLNDPYQVAETVKLLISQKRNGSKLRFYLYEDISLENCNLFMQTMLRLIPYADDTVFHGIGGFSPECLDSQVAQQLSFFDMRDLYINPSYLKDWQLNISMIEVAYKNLIGSGRLHRSQVIPYLFIGAPGQSMDTLIESVIFLHSLFGSVIPVPYIDTSYFPPDMPDYLLSPYIFPHAKMNGYSKEEYFNVLRLIAMLNNRTRGKTTDFFGQQLVGKSFRRALSLLSGLEEDYVVKRWTQ